MLIGHNWDVSIVFKFPAPIFMFKNFRILNCSIHEAEDKSGKSGNGQLFLLVGALLVLSWLTLQSYSYICCIADQLGHHMPFHHKE